MKRLFLLCTCLLWAGTASAVTKGTIFVVTATHVLSYPTTDSGASSPATNVTSASFASIQGVCVDSKNNFVWLADKTNNTMWRIATTDTGSITPGLSIAGAATHMNGTHGCAFDAAGDMWVVNQTEPNTELFTAAQVATGGNLTPTQRITNGSLSNPLWPAVDGAGNVWVANFCSGCSVVYRWASNATGTTAPTATYNYPSFGSVSMAGVDSTPKLYIWSQTFDNINIYNNANSSSSSAGDSSLGGSNTGLTGLTGYMAVDAAGDIIITQAVDHSIRIWNAGHTGNVAPDITITDSTNIGTPTDVAFVPAKSSGAAPLFGAFP